MRPKLKLDTQIATSQVSTHSHLIYSHTIIIISVPHSLLTMVKLLPLLTLLSFKGTQPFSIPSRTNVVFQLNNIVTIRRRRNKANFFEIRAEKENNSQNGGGDFSKSNQEAFLEESSLMGADKVKNMSIEERTKRVMLAENVEDRMVELIEKLEDLLDENGIPKKKESKEDIELLIEQIKAARNQYRLLVTGEECSTLDLFEG